jgi:hypothetical protein
MRPFVRAQGNRDLEELSFLEDALDPESSADELYYFYEFLATVWVLASMGIGLVCVGIAYLLARFDGGEGQSLGLAIFLFVVCFCLAGACDAAWRFYVLSAVRRYYRPANRYLDSSHRLVRLVRRNDTTLLLQIAAGAFFAWRFS